MTDRIDELHKLREQAALGGGIERIKKHKAKGRLTARERIGLFLDEGSFEEFDTFKTHRCRNFGMEKKETLGDGVVTGHGTVNGRQCAPDLGRSPSATNRNSSRWLGCRIRRGRGCIPHRIRLCLGR